MASPQRNAENLVKGEGNTTQLLAKLQSLFVEDSTETALLRSRIDEQSNLICMLKHRADELLVRCQALQKINTELEDRGTDCQTELGCEREKSELLEKRFMDLAANNQAIIKFMDEHKSHNVQLKLENKKLQSENEKLFSQKLQDKDVLVQKLIHEIKQLKEQWENKENEYQMKIAGCQSELQEQVTQHQSKNTTLLHQLHDAQQQQRDSVKMCGDLKLKLQKAEEKHASMEINMRESITSLTKEKDKFLYLSIERGKVIQEKQEEIKRLEKNCKEEKKARAKAEDRFEQEAESVNTNAKVKSLQSALDESSTKYKRFQKDFEAFKEHSTNLLTQERELNKKLRHMMV